MITQNLTLPIFLMLYLNIPIVPNHNATKYIFIEIDWVKEIYDIIVLSSNPISKITGKSGVMIIGFWNKRTSEKMRVMIPLKQKKVTAIK